MDIKFHVTLQLITGNYDMHRFYLLITIMIIIYLYFHASVWDKYVITDILKYKFLIEFQALNLISIVFIIF
jgi:hypothetical protein